MNDVPQQAIDAIKFTRSDAMKMVSQTIQDIAATDLAGCEQAVIRARDAFRRAMCSQALRIYNEVLQEVADVFGKTAEELHATCTYQVYVDGTDSGTTAQVIFSDHQQSFEAKLRLEVTVQLNEAGRSLRNEWACRISDAMLARERDLRVGSMNKEAREKLIKAALDSTEEGVAVVAAIRTLSAALKAKS